jgi:pentatricopeptide repeat protein
MQVAFRSSSHHHHGLFAPSARFLTTFPTPIPKYYPVWDPTKHSVLPPQDLASKSEVDTLDASKEDTHQLERRRLRDTERVIVIHKTQSIEQRHAIRRLNLLLMSGVRGTKKTQLHFPLWRAYSLAKGHVTTLPCLMPERAWDLLWDTQVNHNPRKRSQQSHLKEMYYDMNLAGKRETVGQRIAHLENLFHNVKEKQALEAWEDDHYAVNASSRHGYKPEHLELGAKLYALAGNPNRAREIMEKLFDLYPHWDTSIMMSVFRAHTGLNSAPHHDTAKQIYFDLKERMGSNMTLEHYDAFFIGFLEARHLRYSKQIFRDTVKDGHLAASFSSEQVEAVLKRLHLLYRLGTNIEKMTSIALLLVSVLPQAYHSHVFGDWMKSAVIRKAPEAAAQILDMMFSRGYQPETIHMNLLLKALFRTKSEPQVLKAENIGWRMIEETRKALSKRVSRAAPDIIIERATMITETILDKDAARKVPKADITTFALVMQHHATNLQWEHVDYLTRQLRVTDIQPNATFMNVIMDNYCRRGKYSEAWKTYKSLTDVPEGASGVFPDGASIRCLWKTLRIALGDHATKDDPDLPTPRELLAETVLWWSRCRRRGDVEKFRIGLAADNHGAITSLMMHCFSYTNDFAGSLVALHIVRTQFLIFPSDKSAAILQKQAAWVDMQRETGSVRSQYHHSKSHQNILEKLSQVYYILLEKRLERAGLTEASFDTMGDEELGDLGLNVLSEFIRVVLKRSYPPEAVEAMIDDVKQELGVPNLSTGDLDAFDVA